MAATLQQISAEGAAGTVTPFPLQSRDGARAVIRMAQRLGGVSLLVAASMLVFIPAGGGDTAAMLCKIMVMVVLGFSGMALWQAGSPVSTPELEIDMIRREVRLVRWRKQHRQLVSRRRFSDLGRARIKGRVLQIWDDADTLLAEVTISDKGYLKSLRRALQDEGIPV